MIHPILSKLVEFVKQRQNDIILAVGVILISLLSFAAGYLAAREQLKDPIRIEYRLNSYFSLRFTPHFACWLNVGTHASAEEIEVLAHYA